MTPRSMWRLAALAAAARELDHVERTKGRPAGAQAAMLLDHLGQLRAEIAAMPASDPGPEPSPRVTVVSWSPRILAIEDFLTEGEVDHLAAKARRVDPGGWYRTSLVGIDGNSVPGDTITSKLHPVREDPLVARVRQRMAASVLVPTEHMEPLRFLKYTPSNFFRGHIDAHALADHETSSRLATFFLYLNDVGEGDGGETFFPLAVPTPAAASVPFVEAGPPPEDCLGLVTKDPEVQSAAELRAYIDGFDLLKPDTPLDPGLAARGLRIRPRRGSAIVWWSRRPDGQIDPASQHAGCPLRRGEKYAVVNWMHFQPVPTTMGCQGDCMLRDYHVCDGEDEEPSRTCAVHLDRR